ncbi:MAG TPA: serine/threonine-protein kinase [Chitinivibrionales bacterium]|nr:serine/threonine-protein kinase [Chitinivibrionales bacterium]
MLKETNEKDASYLPDYIGHYKVLQIVGMGGMGVIYKAMQEPLNRIVALKVLPPQLSINEELSKRFEVEAKAISLLQHQNIVSIYEYGEDKGYRFFAMQFVDGENLSSRIQGKKVMSASEIIDISKQICRGLRYAHSQNVIHRDIKPQNILIDKENVARLSDFGIAKIFSSSNITMTGVTVGTPEYMSPEQASGEEVDSKTDIYSMGIVMYEMLTKRPPFLANNAVATAYKHVHEIPVTPSVKRRDTPKRLELIVLKALKKDKNERYSSVEEMLEHLDSVDINEIVDKTTISFSLQKDLRNEGDADDKYVDKRITDRRSGDRRYVRRTQGTFFLFDKGYWLDLIETQWLSLCLIAILAAILFFHLAGHK